MAIGSSVTVGIAGVMALLLGIMGGAFDEEPGCTLHGEGEKEVVRSYEGSTVCSHRYPPYGLYTEFAAFVGEDWEFLDPSVPWVPEIQTSWSTRAGSMTQSIHTGFQCVYWQEGMFKTAIGALL